MISVLLCACETWDLIRDKGQKLEAFEKKTIRKVVRLKKRGTCRILHDKEHRNLFPSLNYV